MTTEHKAFAQPDPLPEGATFKQKLSHYWKLAAAILVSAASLGAILHGLSGYVETYLATRHLFGTGSASHGPTATGQALKPLSVVVIPFETVGDKSDEWFADGLSVDLITDLSRIAGSTIISRSTALSYKGKAVDLQKLGSELGVAYVLSGTVQKIGDRVRVNAQLADTQSTDSVWSEKIDGEWGDPWALQSEITGKIARALNFELINSYAKRLDNHQQSLREPVELSLKAWSIYVFQPSKEGLFRAKALFEGAFAMDPDLTPARVGLASVLVALIYDSPMSREEQLIQARRAEQILQPVLIAQNNNADAYVTLGLILRVYDRTDEGALAFEKALTINPSHPVALRQYAVAELSAGKPDRAVSLLNKLIQISPKDPLMFELLRTLGIAKLLQGETDEAYRILKRSRDLNPDQYRMQVFLAGACALVGDTEGAAQALSELRRLRPDITSIEKWIAAESSLRDERYRKYAENTVFIGLEKAGFPRK